MKKTISIMTATRAEYGLLKNTIGKLNSSSKFDIKIVVTGMHLSPEFGLTYREIEEDGYKIDEKIEIVLSSDTPVAISKSMGLAIISFAEYFERNKPDLFLVLGDRYETLAACSAAMNARIPIAHIHGGETTEGAVDECIRHSITKMSYIHFTTAEEHRKRVIQLGENPDRVYNVGAPGIENIVKMKFMKKNELEESINFKLDKPYAVVTFHSVTLEKNESEKEIKNLLNSLSKYNDMKFLFTMSNADANGRVINQAIEEYVLENSNAVAFKSLGVLRYLSAVKYSEMVIGNSSSGIIEVPIFKIPTVNIGDRQKGRLNGDTIINCGTSTKEIEAAIEKARSDEFRNTIKSSKNLYGDGNTAEKIVSVIEKYLWDLEIDLKKKFFDIKF